MVRLCKTCGELKPIECFAPGNKYKCIDCRSEYQREYKEKNSKKLSEYYKKYRKRNIEKNREAQRNYRIREGSSLKKYKKEWRENNPERVKTYYSSYRARKRNALGQFTDEDIVKLYIKQKGLCFYCGQALKDNYDIDHFTPLSKGGTNYPSNLRLSCHSCNNRKRARDPYEFIQTEFGRLF